MYTSFSNITYKKCTYDQVRAKIYFSNFRNGADGFVEYKYELQMESYIFRRFSPYKYAVKKQDSKKGGDLLWENYKSSSDKNNNRLLMVELDKMQKKGKPLMAVYLRPIFRSHVHCAG